MGAVEYLKDKVQKQQRGKEKIGNEAVVSNIVSFFCGFLWSTTIYLHEISNVSYVRAVTLRTSGVQCANFIQSPQ